MGSPVKALGKENKKLQLQKGVVKREGNAARGTHVWKRRGQKRK